MTIAGAGHEGKYDWANFVFAYSRGKWDPHRLPRPPGPGVRTRITTQSSAAAALGGAGGGGRGSGSGSASVDGVPMGGWAPGSGSYHVGSARGATGMASSVDEGQQRQRHASSSSLSSSARSAAAQDGSASASIRASASPFGHGSESGAPFVDGVGALSPSSELAASLSLAPRRPSLTYVADSPPPVAYGGGVSASASESASAPTSGIGGKMGAVSAEEAAARVAAASQTAQTLLREREMAERAEAEAAAAAAARRDAASDASSPPAQPQHHQPTSTTTSTTSQEGSSSRMTGTSTLAVGTLPDETNSFPCTTAFTSPFTNVAIRNMLENTTGAGAGAGTGTGGAGVHLPPPSAGGVRGGGGGRAQSMSVMPVPPSPSASAPDGGRLPGDDDSSSSSGPAAPRPSSMQYSGSGGAGGVAVAEYHRSMALSGAVGAHIAAHRSQTYGGSEARFDPLAYKRDGEVATGHQHHHHHQQHANTSPDRTDQERSQLDAKTGFRDRPGAGKSEAEMQTKSLPANQKESRTLWESSSIGLSGDDAPATETETEPTPAQPLGVELDEKTQREVAQIAKRDFEEQRAQSSSSSTPLITASPAQQESLLPPTGVGPGGAEDSQAVPVRPGPTPVQTSPAPSHEGVFKKESGAAGEPPSRDGAGSTLSQRSGSGSSSTGSFHNLPMHLHRRRRPSPSTNKSTPPGSSPGAGGANRAFVVPHGFASSSSSPSASVRALHLGAGGSGMGKGVYESDARSGEHGGPASPKHGGSGSSHSPLVGTAKQRSSSNPSMPRLKQSPSEVEEEGEQDEHAESALDTTSTSTQPQTPDPAQDQDSAKVAAEGAVRPALGTTSNNTESMTRHASYSGSPTPHSPLPDHGPNEAGRSGAYAKRKRRPGSSGSAHHHSFKSAGYFTSSGHTGSGWNASGLDSSTVAELRLAASRRKSLETEAPLLLGLTHGGAGAAGGSPAAVPGAVATDTPEDKDSPPAEANKKGHPSVTKQSGPALRLSGKLPLSTVAQSKASSTAAEAAASALGMLKLQLTHSLSFPPDREIQQLWVRQAEAGAGAGKDKVSGHAAGAHGGVESRKGKSSGKDGRAHHSETLLSYTLKHVQAGDSHGGWRDSWTETSTVSKTSPAKRGSESAVSKGSNKSKDKADEAGEPIKARDMAHEEAPARLPTVSKADLSPASTIVTLGRSTPMAVPSPARSATMVPQSSARLSTAEAPASAHGHSVDSDTANGAIGVVPEASSCDLRSFTSAASSAAADAGLDTVTSRIRDGITPSGSAAMNAYLTAGGRAEAFYIQNGYLPAIMPPNEMERRQALKRYGPPKLAGNTHFDRIAHLVKLVFNTKLVLVSLVGENEQIFQTESGGGGGVTLQVLQRLAKSRDCSFCAHAILQDGDEPIAILDASRDWRFAGNPLVLGPPHIRFYAGSPLRTADGYNIGSLCIIDDRPWTEFSPRQRHTLKEFARVVMREMELLRDRIQLGLRDSMQRSIENFTRECVEMDLEETTPAVPKMEESKSAQSAQSQGSAGSGQPITIGIHRIYDLAARAMKNALQVSGAIVFDLSHLELLDTVTNPSVDDPDAQHSVFFPGPLHNAEYASKLVSPTSSSSRPRELSVHSDASSGGPFPVVSRRASDESVRYQMQQEQARLVPPMAVLGSSETLPPPPTRESPVPLSHHVKVAEFLRVHRAGRYFPFIPVPFQHLLPPGMSNVLIVPIFGLNKQPFAMLCAYSQEEEAVPSLDELKESGLQYLRAIGMIVLSAVLKKDIVLADKAKSHFISNISHELRTPLHGILAAAELLAETKMNSTQGSYLETVEACGKSLLELVNHVLDFTKLSGNSQSSMARHSEKTRCDLVKLIQEVCESSWIGSIAKTLENKHSGIGSVYAPPQGLDEEPSETAPKKSIGGSAKMRETGVETVIDISMREHGWLVECDAPGIRRVLMNLIGNSLKFTSSGFVHVSLREIQSTDTHVVIELGVTDTGRGISRSFLEEQLFHPFTQENPLGTGTGLGLSIVNSIVQSPALNGKIDVWSTEGQGTEIRVTCELELSDASGNEGIVYQPALKVDRQYTISLLCFGNTRGEEDLREVVKSYVADWWGFDVIEASPPDVVPAVLGDLVVINEDAAPLQEIVRRGGQLPPTIILTSSRGDASITNACEAYHAAGGVARLLFKPAGPAKLESVLDFCLQCLERIRRGDPPDPAATKPSTPLPSPAPSPHESPAWRPALEQQKSYFGPTADPVTGRDIAKKEDKADVTPTEDKTPGSWNDLTPKPKGGVASPSVVPKDSPHISPQPPEVSNQLLIRRHSIESKVTHHTSDSGVSSSSLSTTSSSTTTGASRAAKPNVSIKTSRPLLPARSITYHEPRLHKHVLLSPRAGLRRALHGGEGQDYFGHISSSSSSGAGSGTSTGGATPTERDAGTCSLPSSPGSTISLEGGEGAVLKTAVHSSAASSASSGSTAGPATPGAAAAYGSSSSSRSGGGGTVLKRHLKVLSIEDNPINRRVIQAFLTKMDIEYVEATDGLQGVKAFAAYPSHYFDVILMDLSMPVLDGIGAMAAIRRIEIDRERAERAAGSSLQTSSSASSQHSSTTGTASGQADAGLGPAAQGDGARASPSSDSASSTVSTTTTSSLATTASSSTSPDSGASVAHSIDSPSVTATAAAAIAAATTSSSSGGGPPARLPHPRTRVKIFALTGRSTDEDKRRAFATGADGYIVKPLSFKVLSSLLKMLAR